MRLQYGSWKEKKRTKPKWALLQTTNTTSREVKRSANVKVTTLAVNAKEAIGGKMSSHDFGQWEHVHSIYPF